MVQLAIRSHVWRVTDLIKRLISARLAVDDRRLADPDVPLGELAQVEQGGVA